MTLRRIASLSVLVALAATVSPVAASAHPLPHDGSTRIVDLSPAPGAVVAAGQVQVRALAISDSDIDDHQLLIDGTEASADIDGGAHAEISADVDLAPGRHVVEVVASSSHGQARRSWVFWTSDVSIDRLAGETRLQTAIDISQALYPGADSAQTAVLARADDFPDALAGVPLAETVDGPLLLSYPDRLSEATADELQRLLPSGATVYVLGGEDAISSAVAEDLEGLDLQPQRLHGGTRFATAVEIARLVPETSTAIIASGEDFPDALSASSPAAIEGYPILLTGTDTLPEVTRDYLSGAGFDDLIVVGGESAVSAEVAAELEEVTGDGTLTRLAGSTRFGTAAAIAEHFFSDPADAAVANAFAFPDALAGGLHAADMGAPLMLTSVTGLQDPQYEQIGAWVPARAMIYGGEAAVPAAVEGDVRRASLDGGGPQLVGVTPDAEVIHAIEEAVVEFDEDLVLSDSSMYVTVGGHEVDGEVTVGDFPRTLVFRIDEMPEGLDAGVRHPVQITVAATDGDRWRHVERELAYEKPAALSRGDDGAAVRDLQESLEAAGYWVGPVDGVYGLLTQQAVMALQKVHGLDRDGVFGPQTREVLESDPPRPTPQTGQGLTIEVDKERQVLLMVRDGSVEWVLNTSTGTGEPYTYDGSTYIASTPSGTFEVFRQIDGWRQSHLGRLWRPKYFNGGIAVHGSTSVPAYPASHGCVRVTIEAMDYLWTRVPIGTPVLVH